jgi:hypothetical protein
MKHRSHPLMEQLRASMMERELSPDDRAQLAAGQKYKIVLPEIGTDPLYTNGFDTAVGMAKEYGDGAEVIDLELLQGSADAPAPLPGEEPPADPAVVAGDDSGVPVEPEGPAAESVAAEGVGDEPDWNAIGQAFGTPPQDAEDYFMGGGGGDATAAKIDEIDPDLNNYDGGEYIRRLQAVMTQAGVPQDQIDAVMTPMIAAESAATQEENAMPPKTTASPAKLNEEGGMDRLKSLVGTDYDDNFALEDLDSDFAEHGADADDVLAAFDAIKSGSKILQGGAPEMLAASKGDASFLAVDGDVEKSSGSSHLAAALCAFALENSPVASHLEDPAALDTSDAVYADAYSALQSFLSAAPVGEAKKGKVPPAFLKNIKKAKGKKGVKESLAKALAGKVFEGRKLAITELEDLSGDPEDFYVAVQSDGDAEVKFDGGSTMVGPFDSPEAAKDAAGSDEVQVVDGEGNPADGVGEDGDSSSDVIPMATTGEEDDEEIPMEAKKMKMSKLRESVLADLRKESGDESLGVETTVGGKPGVDDSGSGNLDVKGADDATTNQAPADVGSSTELSTDADRRPGDLADDAVTLKDPLKGGLASNGPDLSGAGAGKGGVQEAVCKVGQLVKIYEGASRAKIDTGNVQEVSGDKVTLEGGVAYDLKGHFVQVVV